MVRACTLTDIAIERQHHSGLDDAVTTMGIRAFLGFGDGRRVGEAV